MDANFRFRATASSLIAIRGCAPENRFASDSLLEGNGIELPVPRPIGNGFEALSEMGTPC
jgi:hypothetical protein